MSIEQPMNTSAPRRRMPTALAGVAFVAVVGAGVGAYLGIHVVQGAGSGTAIGQPEARTNGVMAYDPADGTVVLFGGQGKSTSLDDTWTWNGSVWSEEHPTTSPPAMTGAQMAYDPVSHDLVLVGGQFETGSGAGGTVSCSAVGSSGSGSASGSTGSTVAVPPITAVPAGTPMPTSTASTPIAVGPACGVDVENAATWLWNGSDWSKASGHTPEVGSGELNLVTDSQLGRAVLLASQNYAEPDLPVAQSGVPVPGPDFACPIAPPASGKGKPVVEPSCPVSYPAAQSNWIWNGHAWVVQKVSLKGDLPPGADGSTIVADPVSGKLAVFVSEPVAIPVNCPANADCAPAPDSVGSCCTGSVSVWTGTIWKQTATFKNGPILSGGLLVADPAAHGDLAITSDGQTWLWTGSWHREHPTTAPTAVSAAAAAYDATTGQVVVFGGFGVSGRVQGLYDQTWTWDGSIWTMRGGTTGPSVKIPVPSPPSPVIEPPSSSCEPISVPVDAPQPQVACGGESTGSGPVAVPGSEGNATGVSAGSTGVVTP
jgi:hypothetical protein